MLSNGFEYFLRREGSEEERLNFWHISREGFINPQVVNKSVMH
jgi:hypothetical protein